MSLLCFEVKGWSRVEIGVRGGFGFRLSWVGYDWIVDEEETSIGYGRF